MEILEVSKLFLSTKKIIFIVALDERIIRDAINRKYPNNSMNVYNDYLNKLIQIPIILREPTENDIYIYIYKLVFQMHLEQSDFALIANKPTFEKICEQSIIHQENYIKKVIQKKDFYFNEDFIEELEAINTIRDMAATCLGSSPRNAKIFLNTFYIRRSLLKYYSIKDMNLSLLAKLMLLEIMRKDCYHDLGTLIKHDVKLEAYQYFVKFCEENNLKNNDEYEIYNDAIKWPKRFNNWRDSNIIDWIFREPINIWDFDLKDYYFLTNSYEDDNELKGKVVVCEQCGEEFVYTGFQHRLISEINPKLIPHICEKCKKYYDDLDIQILEKSKNSLERNECM